MKLNPLVAVVVLALVGNFVVASASAQTRQEQARIGKKVAKTYGKALAKESKITAREIRTALRPGSKVFPQGTGDNPGEARYDALRLGDLGVSFYNQGAGIVIEQIDPKSQLAEYGFQERDRILAIGDQPVYEERDFIKYLFAESRKAGKIGVKVIHDDDRVEVIGVEPSVLLEKVEPGHNDPFHWLGVTLGDKAGNDLRVVEVVPHTPAEMAGIRRGDEIIGFDKEKVKSAKDLAELVSDADRGMHIVRVQRDASEREIEVKLP